MVELEKEQLKLDELIIEFDKIFEKEEELLDDITPLYRKDSARYEHVYNDIKSRLATLNKAVKNPFFARIIFDVDGENLTHDIYISRTGIQDENGNPITVDWRAPIASLYYDYQLGNASYEVGEKTISGNLKLKRQFEIENGKINKIFDVDIVSNDKLLQSYLGVNNDKRLKNIVATIQKEQNDIVRKPLGQNLIIQGVAGCGKTTVALHRIAYLAYNYRKTIKPSQYMVIGPNRVFIDYIKTVLPDLDVNDVCQQTYEEFAQQYINDCPKINDNKNNKNDDVLKFKNSLMYKEMLDLYLEEFIDSIVDKDIYIKDFKVIERNEIKEIFEQFLLNTNTLENAVNKTIDAICEKNKENKNRLISKLNDYTHKKWQEAKDLKEKEEVRKEQQNIKREIDKGLRTVIKKAFNKTNKSSLSLYADFVKNIEKYNIFNYEKLSILKKECLANIKKDQIEFEDIAALMYINFKINNNNFSSFRHVVVDEAQDLGEFNYYMLKTILKNATFSIYGDLAQSIYDYRSIDNWEQVNNIFNNECEIINLNKSYRTTDEIMKAADLILEQLNLPKSEDVIRHGENVNVKQVFGNDKINHIKEKIDEYKQKGYKTIAIICKDDLTTRKLNDSLYIEGIFADILTTSSSNYNLNSEIVTISNPLSKGLEFDAVIIDDCSEEIYNSQDSLDMKLLYVAMTRALHELDIIYNNQLTKPLQKILEKNKIKVKQQ